MVRHFGGIDEQGQPLIKMWPKVETDYVTEVALCHDPQLRCLCVGVYYSSGLTSYGGIWEQNEFRSLDQSIAAIQFDGNDYDPALLTTDEDLDHVREAVIVAMNSCLFLTNYGGREEYESPARARNLLARLGRLRKSKSARKQAQRRKAKEELRNMATVMTIAQTIKFARRQSARQDKGEPTGRTNAPHWRRGHWRQQPCGQGRSQRRQIYISPVLVNARLFGGDDGDTNVTYRLG